MKVQTAALIVLTLTLNINPAIAKNKSRYISEELHKYLESEGLPIPHSGIQITERENISNLTETMLKAKNKARLEMKKNGYYKDTKRSRASELLNLKNMKSHYTSGNHLGEMDTGYRKHHNELRSSFPVNKIESKYITNVIGYAPQGKFDKHEGWSGMVVHFDTNFGSCSLTKSNLQQTGMSAKLYKDDVTYDVNNKVTLVESYGSEQTKYLYSYIWFDKHFYRELECASEVFSKPTKNKVLSLAKELDKQ